MVDDIRPRQEDSHNKKQNTIEPDQDNQQQDNYQVVRGDEPQKDKVDSLVDNSVGSIAITGTANRPKSSKKQSFSGKLGDKFSFLVPHTHRQKIAGGIIAAVLIVSSSFGVYALTHGNQKPAQLAQEQVAQTPEPPKTTETSKLSGLEVPIGTNKKPVYSIQIENSPDARPQSALNQASVVYEAIAEGGITRFNASFLDNEPGYIGPIRSVRPYYAVLASPFDPIFVHAGGSADGLKTLRNLKLKDLDHGANAAAFTRIAERYAPHNLYSSYGALKKAADGRNYKSSKTQSFTRKAEDKAAQPKVNKIDFSISGPLYNVHYDYDKKSNSYKRVMAGTPHKDAKSGKQITPKVVIGLVMNYSKNGIYSVYKTSGSGTAFIFQDGQVQKVTWKKKSDKSQFKFYDAKNNEVGINPGQTWITLLSGTGNVSYK